MSADMILLLTLLSVALTLFITEWLSVDVVTLLMLTALIVGDILNQLSRRRSRKLTRLTIRAGS